MLIISSLPVSCTVSISSLVPIWGSAIAISCDVTPWPHGATVQWMLNNSPFVPGAGIGSNTAERVVIEKATARLTGNWTCAVGYKGKEGRASATLTVRGKIQKRWEKPELSEEIRLCGSSFSTVDVLKLSSFIPFLWQESSIHPKTTPKCTLLWGLLSHSPASSPLV